MKRSVRVCLAATALALGITAGPVSAITATAASASAANASPASAGVRAGRVSVPRVVNLRTLSREAVARHPAIPNVFREPNPGLAASERAAAARSGGRRSGLIAVPNSRGAAAPTGPVGNWVHFPAIKLTTQVRLFGADQNLAPPDTQLAAGPGALVEALNDNLTIWSRTGSLLGGADLNQFFAVPSTQSFSDPRVLYDAQSGRWLLSGLSFDNSFNSQTYLAVSLTSDPFGGWLVYTIEANAGVLTDQPMTGVCDDKVVLSWNDFSTSAYTGAQVFAVQKSALLAGASLSASNTSVLDYGSTAAFRIVPAQSLGSTTTCWMTVNKADSALPGGSSSSPTFGAIAVTGSPGTTTFQAVETDVPIAATTPPPAPEEPGGTVEPATAIDDGLLSAVWQNNQLWTTGTDGCTPPADTALRDCQRLVEVNTSGTPALAQDIDIVQTGADMYYPAVSLDGSGDLFVGFTESSPSLDPGAYAVGEPAGATTPNFSQVTIAAGQASYDSGAGSRWGDYSAVAPDPSAPGAAWATAEYAPSDAASGDWATATAMVSLASPATPALALGALGTGGVPYAQAPQLGSGWHSLGGTLSAPPAVAAAPSAYGGTPATPLFIGTGTNDVLYIRGLTGSWQRIGPKGASCLGSAAAVITGTTLTVACEGLNHALWYDKATVPVSGLPQFVTAWTSLGGTISAGPAVAPVGGVVTFFVRGTSGRVYTRTLTTGFTAASWTCLGALAAAKEAASEDTIFACEGTNHALFEDTNGGTGWDVTASLGGTLTAGPAVAATSRVPFFLAVGSNGTLFSRTLTSGYTKIAGIVVSGIEAVALN